MTYSQPDPADPPMVQVLVDDRWWTGFVRAQEQRDDTWHITVQYHRDGGTYLGGFTAEHVRPDTTDYSRS